MNHAVTEAFVPIVPAQRAAEQESTVSTALADALELVAQALREAAVQLLPLPDVDDIHVFTRRGHAMAAMRLPHEMAMRWGKQMHRARCTESEGEFQLVGKFLGLDWVIQTPRWVSPRPRPQQSPLSSERRGIPRRSLSVVA